MRVLVVGSLPPPESTRATALRSEVTRLLADGHQVEVVAADPVATAHRYLGAGGLAGCLRLAPIVARFDLVVVQLEPGLPVRAKAGRAERELSIVALSLVLRRAREVIIRLERLDDLPGGPSGRGAIQLWRSVDRVVLGSEDERGKFLSVVGHEAEHPIVSLDRSSLRRDLSSGLSSGLSGGEDDGWGEGAEASAENVLELVRKRAARERAGFDAPNSAHVAGWDRLPTPGIAIAAGNLALFGPVQRPRGIGRLARAALALADRSSLLRPLARGIRLARRSVYAVLRPDAPEGSGVAPS